MSSPMTSTVASSTVRTAITTSIVTPPTSGTTTEAAPSTTLTPSTTTTVSQPTPKPTRPTSCNLCNGPPFICEDRYIAHQCQSVDQQFCVTTIHNNDDGTRSVFRSCATETDCRGANRSSDDRRCRDYDPSNLYLDDFRCSWCCNTALCNTGTVPSDLYSP
ncbi:uncharacterized protein LOC110441493 isoform X2 [Mizuhopecten yessoensis]|uniref:uncharacterized protein LOC110441493 isoform X2 n=1 Tax=Mizuhopecten yessoensis TaxID=6573 RepID=UPI000B459219|nr:uncharacterized protein LOC110441493 isoform X2 [Mizuhopecten yessoensis]